MGGWMAVLSGEVLIYDCWISLETLPREMGKADVEAGRIWGVEMVSQGLGVRRSWKSVV